MKKNRTWPVGLTIFYTLFVTAVVAFCIWSGYHRIDLVTPDYYQEELAYQDRIDSIGRTEQLEQPPTVEYREQEAAVRIRFAEPPEHGTTVFYRPSDAGLDQRHPLALDEQGEQAFDTASLRSGLWRVQLSWIQDGEEYFLEEILVVN